MTRRLALLLATLAASACGDPSAPGPPAAITALPRPLTGAETRVRDASNEFAFGLLREANRAHRARDVFVSPLSASMALGMTLNGARALTLDSMRVALGVAGAPLAEVNEGYRTLIALLRGLDPGTELRIANSVWSRTGFPVEPAFTAAVREHFGGTAQAVDFASPAAPGAINAWVGQNTAGKIPTIVDGPIPPDVVMYLINAVYFKGAWRDAFDAADTRSAPFAAPAGPLPVRMMRGEIEGAGYHRAPGVTVVELPYGNGAFAMTIALPDSGASVEALADSLTPARWAAWTAALRTSAVDLAMPRFRLEWEDTFNDELTALGMGIAFDDRRADFTGINRAGGLSISEVKQKTYVDVNEEGTEAAAVTSVTIVETSAPLVPTVRVDRPFVVAIRERLTGSILFVGKIVRPTAP